MIQEFTGFDRVMVYRFYPTAPGEVVADICGLRAERPAVVPAADIPAQARALYMLNKLRLLALGR